ncbi:hypothetical protein HD554DRAFT_2027616, partial [Boletus coccyginus]
EFLQVTDKVRARFPDNSEDLHARATRPVHQSAEVGVTEKRAYVEIDATVGMVCLDNGLKVKFKWKGVCDIQIVVFAQESLYPPARDSAGDNFELLQTAPARDGISVVGSVQWVEPPQARAHKNIAHTRNLFQDCNLRAEFHFDYHLDVNAEPMVWEALRQMRER